MADFTEAQVEEAYRKGIALLDELAPELPYSESEDPNEGPAHQFKVMLASFSGSKEALLDYMRGNLTKKIPEQFVREMVVGARENVDKFEPTSPEEHVIKRIKETAVRAYELIASELGVEISEDRGKEGRAR